MSEAKYTIQLTQTQMVFLLDLLAWEPEKCPNLYDCFNVLFHTYFGFDMEDLDA